MNRWGMFAVVALLIAGCSTPERYEGPEPTGPAVQPPSTTMTSGPAGEAPVAGALYGRVMHQNGTGAPRAGVELYQWDAEDDVRFGMAAFTLGLFCITGECPSSVSVKQTPQGNYVIPPDKMKKDDRISVSATYPAADAQRFGARTTAVFSDGPDPQRVPDLVLWEPELTLAGKDGVVEVSWPRREDGAEYTLYVADSKDGYPRKAAAPTRGTSATVEPWHFEDRPTEVFVSAAVESDGVGYEYRTASRRIQTGALPPSRGKGCLTDDANGQLVPVAAPCVFTDGDLMHKEILVPGTAPAPHRKICVDLGEVREVRRVVMRTPFMSSDEVVELSEDGVGFTTIGTVTGNDQVYQAEVSPALPARIACLRRDRYEFANSQLSEVSVW